MGFHDVDDDYLLVASHLDKTICNKIINQEYVNFSKLLRRDRPGGEDNFGHQKMVMINRGGFSYWVPLNDKTQGITSYVKWDQAFRVYLDVYTSKFPERTSELIQYSHIIQTTSYNYSWENVYLYDREFRRHMKRHLERSWGVILQQAWTMFLKNHLSTTPTHNRYGGNGTQGNQGAEHKSGVSKRLCFTFNRGECTYGTKCKFDHRCGFCGKYGHGNYNCRKAQSSSNNSSKNNGRGRQNGHSAQQNSQAVQSDRA